jgi:hypothetical protein
MVIRFEDFKYNKNHLETKLPEYLQPDSDKYEGVIINNVLLSFLPHGDNWQVLGMYELGKHTIYVGRDAPPSQVEHTKRHEKVHSYGFHDETLTDRIASLPDYEKYDPQMYARAA